MTEGFSWLSHPCREVLRRVSRHETNEKGDKMARNLIALCLLIAVGFGAGGCGAVANAAPEAKWQYKVVSSGPYEGDAETTALLNKSASEGWEVVTAAPRVFNNVGLDEPNAARIRTIVVFVLRKPVK